MPGDPEVNRELFDLGLKSFVDRVREAGVEGEISQVRWVGSTTVSNFAEVERLRMLLAAGRSPDLPRETNRTGEGTATFVIVVTTDLRRHLVGLCELWSTEESLGAAEFEGPVDAFPLVYPADPERPGPGAPGGR